MVGRWSAIYEIEKDAGSKVYNKKVDARGRLSKLAVENLVGSLLGDIAWF